MVIEFKAIRRSGSGKIIEMPEPDIYWDLPKQPEPKTQKNRWIPPFIPYEHPPDYLIPRGGGFYTPSDDPSVIDPQNCNGALADISPWCGGNPFGSTPLGLDPEIAFDECNVWAQINPTIAYMKLTPFTVAYRFPGKCREEPPPPPPPTVEPGEKTYRRPNGIDPNAVVYAFVGSDGGSTQTGTTHITGGKYRNYADTFTQTFTWIDYWCPGTDNLWQYGTTGNWYDSPITGQYIATLDTTSTETYDGKTTNDSGSWEENKKGEWDTNSGWGNYHKDIALSESGNVVYYEYFSGQRTYTDYKDSPVVAHIEAIGNHALTSQCGIFKGIWKWIDAYLSAVPAPKTLAINDMPAGQSVDSGYKNIHVDFVVLASCGSAKDRSKLPPPPDNRRDCCMACCNDSGSKNDALLREILAQIKKANKNIGEYPFNATIFDEDETKQEAQGKTISIGNIGVGIRTAIDRNEKIAKIIGIDALPLKVPKSLSEPVDQNIVGAVWDWLTGGDQETITNLFEYHVWMLKQFSLTLGKWQQEITVQDTDQLKEGQQGIPTGDGETKNKIGLPDISTSMREQMLLQIQQYKIQGLILDVCLKTLTESAATHQTAGRIIAQIDEIVDFLDYPTDDAALDVPVQITVPGKDVSQEDQNDLAKYLKPSKTKVRYDKWTKKESLSDLLTHLATLIGSRGGAG